MTIHDRLPELIADSLDRSKYRMQFIATGEDIYGTAFLSLSREFRLQGAGAYLLNNDVNRYRDCLSESVCIYEATIKRFDQGAPIDGSYVSMVCFRQLFDALASGDLQLAERFAKLMGGRTRAESYNDNPFLTAIGYGYKAAVLCDSLEIKRRAAELLQVTKQKKWQRWAGYGSFLDALGRRHELEMTTSLEVLIKGLPKGCYYGDYQVEDEALFVFGVGLTNLARGIWGIKLPCHPPLVPEELLVTTRA